jgi:hypothetical protein
MISFTVNYIAVVIAAVSAIVLGFLWYGPFFGKPWMKALGITKESQEKLMKSGMGQTYMLMTLTTLVKAFVLAALLGSLAVMTSAAAVSAAFIIWLGISVPLIMGDQLWLQKPWNLFVINASYELVSLGIMSVILVMWR